MFAEFGSGMRVTSHAVICVASVFLAVVFSFLYSSFGAQFFLKRFGPEVPHVISMWVSITYWGCLACPFFAFSLRRFLLHNEVPLRKWGGLMLCAAGALGLSGCLQYLFFFPSTVSPPLFLQPFFSLYFWGVLAAYVYCVQRVLGYLDSGEWPQAKVVSDGIVLSVVFYIGTNFFMMYGNGAKPDLLRTGALSRSVYLFFLISGTFLLPVAIAYRLKKTDFFVFSFLSYISLLGFWQFLWMILVTAERVIKW